MSRKLAIFPIDHSTATFARYAHLGQYETIALLSPMLNVLAGSDISKLDGGDKANIKLHMDYQQKIAESDVVYFVDSESGIDDTLYRELIAQAKKLAKEVIISDRVLRSLENPLTVDQPASPKLLAIDVPIISVLAIGEKCGQAQTEFSLGKYFVDQGYRVLQIGTQEYSHLLGCLSLPAFLFDPAIDVQSKIISFNQFIYQACQQEDPDVIILGVPNPIMKYNNDILNGLGILPFIIQNAIATDIGVVNLYYDDYNYEYLNFIMQLCKYRLNIAAKYFGVSNTTASKNMEEQNKLEYLYVNRDFVKANLKPEIGKDEFTLFSIFDEESMQQACKKIEQELLANVDQL